MLQTHSTVLTKVKINETTSVVSSTLTSSIVGERTEASELTPVSPLDLDLDKFLTTSLVNLSTKLGQNRRLQMRREKLSQEFFF